jgi:ligand-binding sensor domain-containing protein/DNA-binding CsgD family transcriptional regulator
MVSQANTKDIYIANSSGLLEYTGAEWKVYPMPNNTIVRSVKPVDSLIFTGAYMELGFWKKNDYGILEYTSLIPQFPEKIRDGEQFWHMENIGDILIFQSFEGLYTYHIKKNEISRIESRPNSTISNLFNVENKIFFHVLGEGLYKIENGIPQLVIEHTLIPDNELTLLYRQNGHLIIVSQSGNFYRWDGLQLNKFSPEFNQEAKDLSIFSAVHLRDGSLVLGTIENGIYILSPEGAIRHHFNQEKGLLNNTVLSLFLDEDENIWAGLDNGISIINLDSPFRLFEDHNGSIGSVYASFQDEKYFYLGTNQGLYYRENGEENFHFIEGTNGQVWSLQSIDGTLFCGHNKGTYVVEDKIVRRIAEHAGTWVVKKYDHHPNYYLQGHYNGISLLKKQNETFIPQPKLEGFPHSSKSIVTGENGDVWIANEHKGVFRLRLNDAVNAISETHNYQFENSSGITSSIFRFNDTLYYSTTNKIFQFKKEENRFTENNHLARTLEDLERISGKLINEREDKIWGFSNNAIFSVSPAPLSNDYKITPIYLPKDLRNITLGYENVTALGNDNYLLGVANGYLEFEKTERAEINKEIRINEVATAPLDETLRPVKLSVEPTFHYKNNNISFKYSIPEYKKFLIPEYSYRLVGLSEQWSEWSKAPSASFKNLSFGNYDFQVRGKIGQEMTSVKTFHFNVERPWYLSFTAFGIYFLLFLLLLVLIHKTYKKQHEKLIEENEKELRMKNLEAEQKIIKLQNEQLERDVNSKNKELAVSTMSLIKKNEFLTSIKQKLKDSAPSSEVKSVIKTIDKDISEEDNWRFFKEAFNNADKDFFKKIKALHPQLTSNDLKLCAYLRLNLSSKEIAPLLNISVKSVEIKRYRLRKKMDLPREKNLTDYILEI